MAMAGGLGLDIDVDKVPGAAPDQSPAQTPVLSSEAVLFSESAGRFILSVSPENKETFEKLTKGLAVNCVGRVLENQAKLIISRGDAQAVVDIPIDDLETAFNTPFGDMI